MLCRDYSDTKTTGMTPGVDEVIELGMLKVQYGRENGGARPVAPRAEILISGRVPDWALRYAAMSFSSTRPPT